jgi:hypothetical protein
MVMPMSTGNIKIFGCIRCRNAQGVHASAKAAKLAWKEYVERILLAVEGTKTNEQI